MASEVVSNVGDLKAELACDGQEAIVIAGDRHLLTLSPEKDGRGKVKRIEGSHRRREWFQSARKDGEGHFNEANPIQKIASRLGMGCGETSRVYPGPDLVLKKPAREEILFPD